MDYVAEMNPGISDDSVLALARRRDVILLTADKDFGEMIFRQRLISSGVVLIRLAGLSPESKARTVSSAISGHASELGPETFAVVTPGAVRIRRGLH